MKAIKTLLAVGVASVALSACNDLSTEPYGSVVTQDQKKDIVEANPEMAAASVNAIPQMTSVFLGLFYPTVVHTDFGWPSCMLVLDSRGTDMVSALVGYNWYTAAVELSDFGGRYYDNYLLWRTNYNLISTCNSVAALIDPDVPSGQMQYFRAQAVGFRAWAYTNLAQTYQFTYARNPQAPTVPLILDTNLEEAAADGCARATGTEIYAQIVADLTEAIALLDNAEKEGFTRKTQGVGNTQKMYLNQAVCYGLRARAYLLTQNYAAAESDADTAIKLAQAEGITPSTIAEAGVPAFYDINEHNWLWGFYTDPQGSLIALPSWGGQMNTWHASNYPAAGVYRRINKGLYESIPSNDVRKGWWLNGSAAPGNTLPSQYREHLSNITSMGGQKADPYTNTKFGAYQNAPTSGMLCAEDVPYMRVEELYLIRAEAKGMRNVQEGMNDLKKFVTSYRQQNYNESASSTEEFIEKLWFQRRIELWGEGFSYYDMMRFQKPLDRRGGGFDKSVVFNIAPSDPVLLYEIVQTESVNNPLIGNTSNGASIPQPVADEN